MKKNAITGFTVLATILCIVGVICLIGVGLLVWRYTHASNVATNATHATHATHTHANKTLHKYTAPSLGHAASSIDSEQQYTRSTQWKGQPSKCYDCEADMAARCGDACVFNATKQKLFS